MIRNFQVRLLKAAELTRRISNIYWRRQCDIGRENRVKTYIKIQE